MHLEIITPEKDYFQVRQSWLSFPGPEVLLKY